MKYPLLILSLFPLLLSCATSTYNRGLSELRRQSYTNAIDLLQRAEQENPQDARVKRDLGVAYYETRRYDDANAKLNEAKLIDASNAKTVFYLGLTYEAMDMLPEAIAEYKTYNQLARSGGFKKKISNRIKQLSNEQVSREIEVAIATESDLSVDAIPENTVAVLTFRNLGDSPELNPLQKGLAQMMITDLSKVQQLQVVERLKLQRLLEELELGQSGLVEKDSSPRIGKLLGARKLVSGGFTKLADEQLRIDAALTETASSESQELDEITGDLNTFFRLEKSLVFSVIDEFGIELTKAEREAIQKIPTESLLAFIAYSQGLDYQDRGMFDQATSEFQRAVAMDPNFSTARQSLAEVKTSQEAATEPKLSSTELTEEFSSEAEAGPTSSKVSRLQLTGLAAQTGQMPQGDNDTREPLPEETGTDSPTGSSTASLLIRVPLPDGQ